MAYQQAGGPGSGPPGITEHGPQGTDYTLQGVMRFLQVEWHNHERARNAWDIERAEMKAKIAKQEGEIRHSRRLNDQLNRQIKMLEMALRNERKKQGDKTGASRGSPTALSSTSSQAAATRAEGKGKQSEPAEGQNSDHINLDELAQPEVTAEDRDKYRDKSRRYLEKCMQEIQYLLAPPPHAPLPATMPNGPLPGLPEPPPTLPDDRIPRARQFSAQGSSLPLRDYAPNHQAPPIPRGNTGMPGSISISDPSYATPDTYGQDTPISHVQPNGQLQQLQLSHDESQDKAARNLEFVNGSGGTQAQSQRVDDADGWNFDDPQIPSDHLGAEVSIPGRRPDTDAFPSVSVVSAKSPPRTGLQAHRRRSSGASSTGRRRSSGSQDTHDSGVDVNGRRDATNFRVRFALRGHLDVVRSVIFTGGGSPSEPEVCTAGDDGMIKRWIIPATYGNIPHGNMSDLDITSYFTHRGHEGIITCLASCPSTSFSTGGRASGDGWIFSGGEDATIRVWERGRVDPKATLDGHTDAVWSVCALPGTCGNVFREQSGRYGGADRILLASGSADGTVKVWAVSAPPNSASAATTNRRGVGGSRRHSVTSGSNHPTSPQPNAATSTPFHYTLIHNISRPDVDANPTCICPLSPNGDNFAVSYSDSSVLIFDTRTGEEILGMASNETYDGTIGTSINTIAATSSAPLGSEGSAPWAEDQEEGVGAGPTGSAQGLEGVIVSGHEDRYIRFFDANSGQCTYTMLAHTSAISSLSLSHDGHEAVSAGHDASIRFWSLDKRICTQDITSHRPMRGEGVCSVVWSSDGRYVVSAGGDGVVKVFSR